MKSSFMPDYERKAIATVLTALFTEEHRTLSEQVIRAMVNREIDKIISARTEKAKDESLLRYLEDVCIELSDYSAENIGLTVCETDTGKRLYNLHWIISDVRKIGDHR